MTTNSSQAKPHKAGLKSFLTYRLAQLQNNLNAQASALLKKHSDLSLTEWRIIISLNHAGETTMAELARETLMDKGQLSRKLKRLTERTYVLTKQHETDSRRQILCLSESGQAIYQQLVPHMSARQNQLKANFTDDEVQLLDALLDKLSENVITMKNDLNDQDR